MNYEPLHTFALKHRVPYNELCVAAREASKTTATNDFQPPEPPTIRQARLAAGMTQSEAARAVLCSLRTWQQWEAGDRRMHPGLWELFRIRTSPADTAG